MSLLTGHSHRKTEYFGEDFGLALGLSVLQDEYLYATSRAAGVRVMLHGPYEYPNVQYQGIRVSPGQVTSIGVKRKEV